MGSRAGWVVVVWGGGGDRGWGWGGVENGLFVLAKQYGLIGSCWSQNRKLFLIAPIYRCILALFPSFVVFFLLSGPSPPPPPPTPPPSLFIFIFKSVLRTCLSVSISPSLVPVLFHHCLSARPFPLLALCEHLPFSTFNNIRALVLSSCTPVTVLAFSSSRPVRVLASFLFQTLLSARSFPLPSLS